MRGKLVISFFYNPGRCIAESERGLRAWRRRRYEAKAGWWPGAMARRWG